MLQHKNFRFLICILIKIVKFSHNIFILNHLTKKCWEKNYSTYKKLNKTPTSLIGNSSELFIPSEKKAWLSSYHIPPRHPISVCVCVSFVPAHATTISLLL